MAADKPVTIRDGDIARLYERTEHLVGAIGTLHGKVDALATSFGESATKQGERIGLIEQSLVAIQVQLRLLDVAKQFEEVHRKIDTLDRKIVAYEGQLKVLGVIWILVQGVFVAWVGWR